MNILGDDFCSIVLGGLLAGIGYVLAELPNSFIKRRLGIGAGEVPTRGKYLVILADQLDSGIGFSLAYYWYLQLSIEQALVCALSFPMTALVVKRLLFIAKLKKSAT
ncbi:MAG: CDP-archaeol synthase [Moraxellaceae bacterium]|nr:CDP-archaeol synthase [Moraxellaceae bacterium]